MCLRLPTDSAISRFGNMDREALGIPSEQELISQYCTVRELDEVENWLFYLAFSYFRSAAISQGALRKALDGNDSSERALRVGREAIQIAEDAVKLL